MKLPQPRTTTTTTTTTALVLHLLCTTAALALPQLDPNTIVQPGDLFRLSVTRLSSPLNDLPIQALARGLLINATAQNAACTRPPPEHFNPAAADQGKEKVKDDKTVKSAHDLAAERVPLSGSGSASASGAAGASGTGTGTGTGAATGQNTNTNTNINYAIFRLTDAGNWYLHTGPHNPTQQLFTDRSGMGQGILQYTTGTALGIPRNGERGPFAVASNEVVFAPGNIPPVGFQACPITGSGAWKVWLQGVENPAGYKNCVGFILKATRVEEDIQCAYSTG